MISEAIQCSEIYKPSVYNMATSYEISATITQHKGKDN
uniref:Uncharacterized protein n=1 Tax=Arundo donax TaxID=35708 RepID=A0A0A9CP69_ARUDO